MNDTVPEPAPQPPEPPKEPLRVPKRYGRDPARRHNFVRRVFLPALAKAKVEGFRWHDLRHTFASRLVMKGVDLRTVQELLGHKTLMMTLRYSHLSPAHQLEAVQRLNETPTATSTVTEESTEKKPGMVGAEFLICR